MDRPVWRQIVNRIDADLLFLRRVRGARERNDVTALVMLEDEVSRAIVDAAKRGRGGPRWRGIVLARAFREVFARLHAAGSL